MFWGFFLGFFFVVVVLLGFFSGKGKVLSSIFKQLLQRLTLPFCLPVIWKYIHTYLSLDNLGKWGFDNSPRHHTEFYDDDQNSSVSYSLWIISKTCIKDNSGLHFFESALVFIQDHCPASSQDKVNFYSSQEEACLGPWSCSVPHVIFREQEKGSLLGQPSAAKGMGE